MSETEQPREAMDVVYFPYLPLRERITVGEWELIPRAGLVVVDCLDERSVELALGLAGVYVLPERSGVAAGVFARPRDGHVGDKLHDLQLVDDLRRACIVAVLDVNPSPLDDERDPNAGHWMLTSDNAIVVAHGINREHGYTGSIIGSRLPEYSLGVSVVEDTDKPHIKRARVLPPGGLRVPTFNPPPLDVEYADATWASIRRGDDDARRLGRAIDWLAVSWLNATALTDDVRVPALRAGFEVLLDHDDFLELARRLTILLADQSPPAARTWGSRSGKPVSENLTDIGWWFVQFSFLRNALMHGGSPAPGDWAHDNARHIDLGDWHLRQAIKHTVANDGHPDVLEELAWRDASRATRAMHRGQSADNPGSS